MACDKTLTFHEVSAADTPLHTAIYVPSTDKILGTCLNYIIEFNASTGAYIRSVKTIAPMLGPMYLGFVGGVPHVSCHNDPSHQNPYPPGNNPSLEIFRVNTTTLLTGVGVGLAANFYCGQTLQRGHGPYQFFDIGDRVYFLWPYQARVLVAYMDVFTFAQDSYVAATGWCEQMCTDGTYIYAGNPYYPEMDRYDVDLNPPDSSSTETGGVDYWPTATEWVPTLGKPHAVGGTKWMIRVDDWNTQTNTYIDLEAALAAGGSVITGIKPIRLRYRSLDQKLYIPEQNQDGVIVFNPADLSAVWKSGFESPVDIVFTPTRAFAVQSSGVGLKEIV